MNTPNLNITNTIIEHDGAEKNVIESYISDDPEIAIREVLKFIQSNL